MLDFARNLEYDFDLDLYQDYEVEDDHIKIVFEAAYEYQTDEENYDCNRAAQYAKSDRKSDAKTHSGICKDFSAIVPIDFKAINRNFFRYFHDLLEDALEINEIDKTPSFEIVSRYSEDLDTDILYLNNPHPQKDKIESILNAFPDIPQAFSDLYISFVSARSSSLIREKSKLLSEKNLQILLGPDEEQKKHRRDFAILVTDKTYSVLSGNYNYLYFVDWLNDCN